MRRKPQRGTARCLSLCGSACLHEYVSRSTACSVSRSVCVCVIVYLLEQMFLAIQKYLSGFIAAPPSLTSHIIKSSGINYYTSSVCKIKNIIFLHTRNLSLSQVLSLIFTPFSSLFPDPRGVVLPTCPSYYPRGTGPRWADTPAAPGRADSLSRQFLAHGYMGGQ
jgi:hypothetical protein